MISANEIRNRQIKVSQVGYDKEEVNILLDEAADTVDGYVAENKELYHKLEVLANKIEEYRAEEDSIKSALITAQKMADQIKKESAQDAENKQKAADEKARETIDDANKHAENTMDRAKKALDSAKSEAERILNEANEKAQSIIAEKTAQGNDIIENAEKKANDAINSAKIVAQNILDQSREISNDLVQKSKEEKEAYDLLVQSLKSDAERFIGNIKALYSEQLEVLNAANLETSDDDIDKKVDDINDIHDEVKNLVSEIGEMESAIPEEIHIEKEEQPPVSHENVVIITDDDEDEQIDEPQPEDEPSDESQNESDDEENEISSDSVEDEDDAVIDDIISDINAEKSAKENDDVDFSLVDESEDMPDPMAAVEAFNSDTVTPIDDSDSPTIPEITDDGEDETSLFDDETQLPFENYFNVKREDVHGDRTQTISLTAPEEDEDEDDAPKFKGFFKKKK